MLKLRPRSIYDVMAAIACFGVLAGGTAYAANEWTGANIVDGSLTGADVFNNTIGSTDITNASLTGADVAFASISGFNITDETVRFGDIQNGSLNDEDVGQGTFVNFAADIGTVAANTCVERSVTGVNAGGDHLLLTPAFNDADPRFVYQIQYSSSASAFIEVCNISSAAVNDGITHFNLLVFDAQ